MAASGPAHKKIVEKRICACVSRRNSIHLNERLLKSTATKLDWSRTLSIDTHVERSFGPRDNFWTIL
ncbi:unnamed protein product [Knipowitschia caucasica]